MVIILSPFCIWFAFLVVTYPTELVKFSFGYDKIISEQGESDGQTIYSVFF